MTEQEIVNKYVEIFLEYNKLSNIKRMKFVDYEKSLTKFMQINYSVFLEIMRSNKKLFVSNSRKSLYEENGAILIKTGCSSCGGDIKWQ